MFSYFASRPGAFFRTLRAPDRERQILTKSGQIRVQVRGEGAAAKYYLRLGGFGAVNYFEIDKSEFLRTIDAMVDIAEDKSR